MRLGKRLLGMDVFVLSTGRNLGQVQDLIFSVSSSKLMALLVTAKGLVDGEGKPLEFVIKLDDVHRVGSDAVIIGDLTVLRRMDEILSMGGTWSQTPDIVGLPVITTGGTLLGTLDDVLVDTQTGDILGFQLSDGLIKDLLTGRVVIPASSQYQLGSEALIVPEDTVDKCAPVESFPQT